MGNKFKTGLVKGYREEQAEQQRQEQLKERLNIPDNVVVVEKSNTFQFTVTMLIRLMKLTAMIALSVLAFIGLLGILYLGTRAELLKIADELIRQLQALFGG